jgi:hypothetical protein
MALIPAAASMALGLYVAQPVVAAGRPSAGAPANTPQTAVEAPNPVFSLPHALSYSDCSGAMPLGRTAVYRDLCMPGVYLVAHNPGPFTSIVQLLVGDRVSYQGHVYAILSRALMTPATQWNEAQRHPADLTLQTCAGDAQSRVWVFKGSEL